ncbi:hypothetical protein ACJVC5_15095 [Peredibacter sp. HCB2-198]|uniref:hypothetical protein n=1 Tax=Peredibacter sp. HCB2-198 TaxID=3383025 RepID=UPI0038B557EB
MKILVLVASLLMMSSAFATELKFKCEMKDIHYMNEFSLDAKVISLEGDTFENIEFDFTLKKAGFNTESERLVVNRDGEIKQFEAGTFGQKRSVGLISAVKGAEVELVSLFIDFAGPFHSQIRFLNGMTYYGSCYSL